LADVVAGFAGAGCFCWGFFRNRMVDGMTDPTICRAILEMSGN
jgi:hypothetical protein